MSGRTIKAADLFCGAGGTSTGLMQAAGRRGVAVELTAVNHWDRAIETHAANHAEARHLQESLDGVDPRKLFPQGLDILMASPECTHHSNARGGKPMCDQSRSTAWHVLRWAEALQPREILIENVREMESWGPIGASGRPIESRKGETFRAWIHGLRSLGYRVEWRILNAADYSDATTRRRLFIRATKGKQVQWPEATHSQKPDLFAAQPWRPAREIIDWSIPGKSIFSRKTPLRPKTLARIEEGMRRFGGAGEAFVLGQQSCSAPRGVDQPLPTIAGAGAIAVVQPFLMNMAHRGTVHDSGQPLPTITTARGGEMGVVMPCYRERVADLDSPLPTITCAPRFGLVQPYLIELRGTSGAHSVDKPLGTVTAGGEHFGLLQPFLIEYYGNGAPLSIGEPLPTVTTHDRFALVHGRPCDILFRMLLPHELAAAMSFPAGYRFAGNRQEVTKQIGNAVAVGVAEALTGAMLRRMVA